MPTYDYRCETNDRVVEVNHRMSESLATWGELCERTGTTLGDTPADAPVHRLATGGNVVSSRSLGSGNAPACSTGACCPGGMCGLN
jgi:predicted nucleic acid-binding Zn ribbon protein